MNPLQSGEVLRGMHVERHPLCVGRPVAPVVPLQEATATDPREEAWTARLSAALAEARREGERAGYEEGLRKGLADARSQGEAALQKAVAGARATLDQQHESVRKLRGALEAAHAECLRLAEDEMVALCFDTICRVVGEEALAPEHVRARIRQLVASSGDEASVAIHLHPRDAALFDNSDEPDARGRPTIRCVPDPQVAPGDCTVRGTAGGLEQRLESTLEACKRALLHARAQVPAAEGQS